MTTFKQPLAATLTGTALIKAHYLASSACFSKDVSLELVFSDDRTQIGICPVEITTTGVRTVSDGGTGDFHQPSGSMSIPLRVQAKKNGMSLHLGFVLSTEVGESCGPFTPRGSRLGTDGSVTLAGAALDSVFGISVSVMLVITGTIEPIP